MAGITALVTRNWDRAGGNDLVVRDSAGMLWPYSSNSNGRLGSSRQIGGYNAYAIASPLELGRSTARRRRPPIRGVAFLWPPGVFRA